MIIYILKIKTMLIIINIIQLVICFYFFWTKFFRSKEWEGIYIFPFLLFTFYILIPFFIFIIVYNFYNIFLFLNSTYTSLWLFIILCLLIYKNKELISTTYQHFNESFHDFFICWGFFNLILLRANRYFLKTEESFYLVIVSFILSVFIYNDLNKITNAIKETKIFNYTVYVHLHLKNFLFGLWYEYLNCMSRSNIYNSIMTTLGLSCIFFLYTYRFLLHHDFGVFPFIFLLLFSVLNMIENKIIFNKKNIEHYFEKENQLYLYQIKNALGIDNNILNTKQELFYIQKRFMFKKLYNMGKQGAKNVPNNIKEIHETASPFITTVAGMAGITLAKIEYDNMVINLKMLEHNIEQEEREAIKLKIDSEKTMQSVHVNNLDVLQKEKVQLSTEFRKCKLSSECNEKNEAFLKSVIEESNKRIKQEEVLITKYQEKIKELIDKKK
uniref:hypothetical protein n=1 Tax=Paralagenidium karlingii TaxID=1440115 RepID=UPI0026E20278|nr:hypothetical protein Q6B14_mgp19 [Paralagenidium karlingii]WJH17930.1 hypothetical protein [Paralagenidium karlingii]